KLRTFCPPGRGPYARRTGSHGTLRRSKKAAWGLRQPLCQHGICGEIWRPTGSLSKEVPMNTVLLVILVLALLGALPTWPYHHVRLAPSLKRPEGLTEVPASRAHLPLESPTHKRILGQGG